MSTRTDVSSDATTGGLSEPPVIRRITTQDLRSALRRGREDFLARPTHGVFLTAIYLLIAAAAAFVGLGENLLFLLLPVLSGLALIGPLAACGLYELSRRREQGSEYAWWHVFDVLNVPSRWSITGMGVLLAALFAGWLMTAVALYEGILGSVVPDTAAGLFQQIFMTPEGWQLLAAGTLIGFIYSVIVFVATVVALPMMVERRVGLAGAVGTSLRAVAGNVKPMAAWYLIVAGLMLAGAVPMLIGLGVVAPILGHATWHLYRAVVE